jgi:hypothetical protein
MLVDLKADSKSAGRLRGLILPEGPLAWAAFDRTGTKAVVAYFHWNEFFPRVREAIETTSTVLHTVEVDYSLENYPRPRLFPLRQDAAGSAFVFVQRPSAPSEDLNQLLRGYAQVGTTESGGLVLIQLQVFEERQLSDLERMILVDCPVVDKLIVGEAFWGNEGGRRDWE